MTLYKSIFDIPDLTPEEKPINVDIRKLVEYRKSRYGISLYESLDKDKQWELCRQWERGPITTEEYSIITTQAEKYEDLFYLYMNRGDFETAFEYEKISGINYKAICNIPFDVISNNEYLYRIWRFE